MTDQVRAGRRRGRRLSTAIVILSVGLLSLTAWNVTRSEAMLAARQAYSKEDFALALARSLEHLDKQPWSGEAAVLAANCLSRLNFALEAEPYYRRAGQLELSDLQIRAYGLARGPQPELAIPAFHEVLARSPSNVTAMRRLAGVLLVYPDRMAELLDPGRSPREGLRRRNHRFYPSRGGLS